MNSYVRRTQFWLVLLIHSGTCQILTQNGVVGNAVLLSCKAPDPTDGNIDVFWRDGNDNAVLNIIGGQPEPGSSSQKYSSRVDSFREEFRNGNFSIKLKKLQLGDADTYQCNIPDQDFSSSIKLEITGEPNVETTRTPSLTSPGSDADVVQTNILGLVLLSLISLLL